MDLFFEDTEGVTSSTTAATTTSVTIAAKTADNSESLSKKKKSTLIESMQHEEPKRKSKKQDTNDLPNIDELPPETSTNSTTTPIPKKSRGNTSNNETTTNDLNTTTEDISTATPTKSTQKGQRTQQSTADMYETFVTPRVSRHRNKTINYNDNMSESQFVRMVEKSAAEAERMDDPNAKVAKASPSKKQTNSASKKVSQSTKSKKKKKSSGGSSISSSNTLSPLLQILSTITNELSSYAEPKTNRLYSEMFLEKPCAQTYPDYYVIITNPIAIKDIRKKCQASKYVSVDEFVNDWSLLFQNAKCYNEEGSWIVEDGYFLENELHRLLHHYELLDDTTTATTTSSKKRSRDSNKDEYEEPSSNRKKPKRNGKKSKSKRR